MTNEIQGVGSGSMMPQARQARMTESQKTSFQEIISKYDAKNFTIADFEAMGKEFRQAGISPPLTRKKLLSSLFRMIKPKQVSKKICRKWKA